MENQDFKNKVNAILKVQLQENLNRGNSEVPISPYIKRSHPQKIANSQWSAVSADGEWTHYLSLKIAYLEPLGQLLDNINRVQDEMINELGLGVVEKSAHSADLHIRLLAMREVVPNALSVSLQTLGGVSILGTPTVDFGGVITSSECVSIALFSETLEEMVTYIHDHLSKTPGIEIRRVEPNALKQKGLFKLEVINVLRPENFKKPSQKARFGRYGWSKIEVVNILTNAVYAKIDVSCQ